MTALYGLCCVASFLFVVAFCGLFPKTNMWFTLTFISIFICNTGYFTLALSRSLEEALLANRVTYLGSVFLPFFLLMTIMKVCRFRYPRFLPPVLTAVNTAVLLLTVSGGYSQLYYKTAAFETVSGVGRLIKDYGILHRLYYIYLIAYFGAIIIVIIRSFFRTKTVSYKHAVYLAITVFINITVYFIEKLIAVDFELLSFMYVITEIFLLILCKSLEDYDIENIIRNSLATDRTGVILFDNAMNFKGCNEDAASVFPGLTDLKLEYPVPSNERELHTSVIPVLKGDKSAANMTFRRGDRIYRLTAKPFVGRSLNRKHILGTAVVINDDTAQQEYFQLISSYNDKLRMEVALKTAHVLQMHDNLILGMADMVEGRDPNTGGHIRRTSSVVDIFVKRLVGTGCGNFTSSFLDNIAKAAPMHDLGKIAIDDAILRKPGKYTPEEYAVMRTHAEKGAAIVGKILKSEDDPVFYAIAVNVAHYHHEKYDGTGYPCGLKEEQIPVAARIMALADVFDALVSKRCYKEKYTYTEAFCIIRDSLGKHFDPRLGSIFLECETELTAYYTFLNDN